MTTSGTAVWNPDVAEIIEEAYERAGVEIRTGYQLKTARRSLNIMMAEWANRGINLWTVEQGVIPLTQGTVEYPLPADTVDLIEHVIRQNPGNTATQVDLQITRIALPTYATLPNKLTTGRPIQLYVDRQAPVPNIKIWPTANNDSYTLVYWRLRRLDDAGNSGTLTMDVPFRFVPMLKQMYDEAWQQASDEDRDKAPIRFVPYSSYIGSRGW